MDQVDFLNGKTRLFGIVGDPIEQVQYVQLNSYSNERLGLVCDGLKNGFPQAKRTASFVPTLI